MYFDVGDLGWSTRANRNRKFKASRDYIVGGEDTLEHQHPWQVYIEKLDLPEKNTKEHGNDYSDYEYDIDPHQHISHGHFMGFWRNNKPVKKNHFGKFVHGHGDISGMFQSRASREGNTKQRYPPSQIIIKVVSGKVWT